MNRRLIISTIARLDLVSIHDAIAQHNLVAADRLLARIQSTCLLLVDRPMVGAQYGEGNPGLRFSVVGKYVVYYRVLEDAIWIQRVLHGARDASRLL